MKVDLSELPKNILNDALLKLKALLQAESASLFLLDREHQELVLNAVLDDHKAQYQGLRQPVTDGVAGSVAMRRQAVLVKDISTDPRFSTRQFRHYHTNSFICVPLGAQDGLFGVINISYKMTREPFTEDYFHLACLIAQLTSRLVENEMRFAAARAEIDVLKKEKAMIKEERVFLEKFASMGKLAGGIVHEINNPLDGVMRYT